MECTNYSLNSSNVKRVSASDVFAVRKLEDGIACSTLARLAVGMRRARRLDPRRARVFRIYKHGLGREWRTKGVIIAPVLASLVPEWRPVERRGSEQVRTFSE